MRARVLLSIVPVTFLIGSSAALAQAADKTTDLKPFDQLQVEGCFDARLVPGTPAHAVVTATADQQQRIRVEQDGKRVRVGFAERDDYNVCRGGPIRVAITASFGNTDSVGLGVAGSGSLDANVPRVAELRSAVAGSGRIALKGAAGDCDLKVSGSGIVDATALACDSSARVGVHGSGSTKVAGKTRTCNLEVNGSGAVAADSLECDSAEVAINGSGSIGLAKLASLSVQINGSGNVKYRGEPTLRGIAVNGSGRLIKE
jgi:putative autotransporter adhesin-like protein